MDPFDPWLTFLRVERGLQTSTITAYARELRSAAASVRSLPTATTAALRAWLHAAGGSPSTVSRRIAALRSYFGWLTRTGARSDDPTSPLERPKVRRGLPRPVEDLDGLLIRATAREQAVILFLVETGLRISEACAVQVPTPAPADLVIRGKGGRERLVPLSEVARAAIDELGGSLGWSARTVQRRLHALGCTPHRMRHTFATGLSEAGADLGDIQQLLGHASPATTLVYTRISAARLRRAIDLRGTR
jgi:site-specific recombinase XerD